jgi:hypothetical protein
LRHYPHYALDLKHKNKEVETQVGEGATKHDKELFQNFMSQLPSDGRVMEWLKLNFVSKYAPTDLFDTIEATIRNMSLKPVGFDDADVNSAYEKLRLAMEAFVSKVLEHMWSDHNHDYKMLVVPPEWDEKRSRKAFSDIVEARNRFLVKYDAFLTACHASHVDC